MRIRIILHSNPAEDEAAYDELRSVDKYMTIRFNYLLRPSVTLVSENFLEFLTADSQGASELINVDLSAFYLDFAAKDVVYIEGASNLERRQMQTKFSAISL